MANQQIGLLGRKLGMVQLFDDNGTVAGATVLEVGPNTILRVKGADGKDGYAALQLGFGTKREKLVTKAELGAHKAAYRVVREIRVEDAVAKQHEAGAQLGATNVFAVNDKVDVRGVSKGRGFAGVMKRHNFSGFKRTHGAHEYFRHGGSIGTRLTPGMTLKGVKMPGHMGAAQVTVQNLKVVKIDADRNLLFVKGGVPGPVGAYIVVRKAVKTRK